MALLSLALLSVAVARQGDKRLTGLICNEWEAQQLGGVNADEGQAGQARCARRVETGELISASHKLLLLVAKQIKRMMTTEVDIYRVDGVGGFINEMESFEGE